MRTEEASRAECKATLFLDPFKTTFCRDRTLNTPCVGIDTMPFEQPEDLPGLGPPSETAIDETCKVFGVGGLGFRI